MKQTEDIIEKIELTDTIRLHMNNGSAEVAIYLHIVHLGGEVFYTVQAWKNNEAQHGKEYFGSYQTAQRHYWQLIGFYYCQGWRER